MPTIKFSELKCIRQHDVTGVDEPKLTADGSTVWSGTLKKGGSKTLGDDYDESFTGSIDLKLFENNSKGDDPKQIGGTVVVDDDRVNNGQAVFKTSGTHYELYYRVV